MTSPTHRVRRATLDDLPNLKSLWTSMRFSTDDLEKRLTEFQVVESATGHIVGAIGIQIHRPNGWLHNEAYQDFALADEVRPLLVERIKSLASNHGVLRLWTTESAPFWTRSGFQPPTPEILKRLPESWAKHSGPWLTMQLKDEDAIISLEKELALFMEAEKQRTQRAFRHARILKAVATFLAIVFGIFVLVAMVLLLRRNPAAFGHGQ